MRLKVLYNTRHAKLKFSSAVLWFKHMFTSIYLPVTSFVYKKMIFNSPTKEIPNPFSVAKLLYNSNYPSMIFAASIKYRGLHIPPIYHNLFYTIFCPFVLILSYNLSWGQLPFYSILKLDKTIFWCFNSKRNRASVKNLEILNNILKNIIHI